MSPREERGVQAKVKPGKVVVDRTRAKVIVMVKADGAQPTAGSRSRSGETYRAKLKNGRAVVKLPKFAKTGKKTVRVKYLGNATTTADTAKVTFRVVKK